MKRAWILGWIAIAATSGCASLPAYTFQPGEITATVNLKGVPAPSFCAGGTMYKFTPDKQGRAHVPVGKRIDVNSFVYLSGYQQYWTCHAGMSFVPEASLSYLVNLEMRDQACRVEIYREGASNRTGLDLEPSFGRPSCR
jgi:hypothetical protein